MNEQRRMQYLEAMGVEMFTPRWVLPGARASHLCQLPVANSTPRAEVESVPSEPDLVQPKAAKSAGAVVGSLLDVVQREAPVEAKPKPEAEAVQPVRHEAAFSLAFWRVHPHIMVVDSRQAKALPTQALLQSILNTVGVAGGVPRAEIQTWPVPGSADKTWDAAREMIQAFLETRLLTEPVKYLVVMGQDAARAVLADAHADHDINANPEASMPTGRVNLDSFACEALVTPSLSELLLEPRLKAGLWSLLAPLRHCVNE